MSGYYRYLGNNVYYNDIEDVTQSLPRLPIPSLEKTLARYLDSVKPLLSHGEFKHTTNIVKAFGKQHGPGEYLQKLLRKWDDEQQPKTWLEQWWLELAYLSSRDPLCPLSNYWLLMADDPEPYGIITEPPPNHPPLLPFNNQNLNGPDGPFVGVLNRVGYGDFQIRRAAKIIEITHNIMESIYNKEMPAEMARGRPICMEQWLKVFGTTRIPKIGCDELVVPDTNGGQQLQPSTFIVALIDDQIFRIEVYDKFTRERLLVGDVENQLRDAIAYVEKLPAHKRSPAINVLASGNRDRWASIYAELLKNPRNKLILKQIIDANFVISLDDTVTLPYGSLRAAQYTAKHHAARPDHNRWADKLSNFIIDRNGVFGFNGEHSPVDGFAPGVICINTAIMLNHPENRIKPDIKSPTTLSYNSPDGNLHIFDPSTSHLKFEGVNDKILRVIDETSKEIRKIALESISFQHTFEGFGGDWIKNIAKLSADAFVQVASQLAYYRTHATFVATYETSSSRKFHGGRTDTIRAFTTQVADFVKAMEDPRSTNQERYRLLRSAFKTHVNNVTLASNGEGIDRHLLGLKLAYDRLYPKDKVEKNNNSCASDPLSGEAKKIIEDFFNDPAFQMSCTWRLSTSAAVPSPGVVHSGYCALGHDKSYGNSYMILKDKIRLGLEGRNTIAGNGSKIYQFEKHFASALWDMRRLCEKVGNYCEPDVDRSRL
ncbi:hypothetical protein H4219_004180 [Mycoemilia scoparia]|uniref:Choline/carnitine acyltransferase domain-containing protein n=1 Tax=Mycoemilia scoparia TaxID=417184 RepID=A0A9W7ZY56_9FUNG|nr:hypothetical protein H4219_004180 [Mycoemilia scoparia]